MAAKGDPGSVRLLIIPFLIPVLFGALQDDHRLAAQEMPHLDRSTGATQLIVGGQPFIIFGGELSNSAAGTYSYANEILPRVVRSRINTVLMPVGWEQIEPVEGRFDFAVLDHWIEQARVQRLRLVLLWFGSWKNAFSSYVPEWVKKDPKRFRRVIAPDGRPLEILSAFSNENVSADARAFRSLMRHVKEIDLKQQTVLMVQVENEAGILGAGREHSAEADRLFDGLVPQDLMAYLHAHRDRFSPELSYVWNGNGRTWKQAFNGSAPEVFTTWSYARYIGQVAAAGKDEYPLPMYVNAQLPAPLERAGEYPSSGPHPYYLEIYRSAAPALDFFSPDIYWPNFEYWVERYRGYGNPVFVPEARLEAAPFNAFYAYGEARAFGFSPFSVDSLPNAEQTSNEGENAIGPSYSILRQLEDILPQAQREGRTRAVVLHIGSLRPTQTVSLGGYLFTATLARSWPARTILQDDGAMIVVQTAPDEFLIGGSALTITVAKDFDDGAGIAGIASIERGSRVRGAWETHRRLNGDQNNQGRDISLAAHGFELLRVKLYTIAGP